MLLVIDVGNTNIVLGLYNGETLMNSWRMSTGESRTADETGIFIYSLFQHAGIDASLLEQVIISSVVPNMMYSLTHGIKKYFKIEPMVVNYKMRLDLKMNKDTAREMGADRLVNNVAAMKLYGGPVIVIDYGTATTYDAVAANGEFITGITAPGIKISADALFQRAALLGKVELVLPQSLMIANTIESVQAGILYGRIGETEYIVGRLKKEIGLTEVKVVATGGLARTISQGTDVFDYINPMLTLEGLRLIYEMNK